MLRDKQKRLRLAISFAICLCLAYTAGFGVFSLRSELVLWRSTALVEERVFWEAWSRVERHFYGAVPSAQTRTYGAITRSLTLLDPYTVLVEPVPRELEQHRLRGAYGGIGVTIWRTEDRRFALSPYPDSPAERAGLVRGDVLVAIDGELVSEALTASEVEVKLRGAIGTTVHVTVSRSLRSSFETTIERERIEVPSVTWRMESVTAGYVQVTAFTERTDDELAVALAALDEAEARGLILDLRGNRGGLLGSAVAVASQFLEPGDVVLHQAGRSAERIFRADRKGDRATPLVVLVDEGTASAAEIVAGALQDHNRAPLMGEPTFGKGSVQGIYDLSDGSSLHITTAVWLTPDRHRIDKQGLTPDIFVVAGNGPEDQALRRAVSYLESG